MQKPFPVDVHDSKVFGAVINRLVNKNRKGHEVMGYRTFASLYDDEYTIVITFNKSTAKKQQCSYLGYKHKFLKNGSTLAKKLKNQSKKGKNERVKCYKGDGGRYPKEIGGVPKYS